QNGPRLLRRAVRGRRETVNVIARLGASEEEPAGTLVVLAHHDAPQTGVIFDQRVLRRLHELAPDVIEGIKTSPPQWWLGLAGPACTLAAAIARRPRLAPGGPAHGPPPTAAPA